MKSFIEHKTHMKAEIGRCPEKSADFEKVIMTLIMRMLNRKVKRSTIASEQKVENSEDISDVCVETRDGWVHYEIQKEISEKWNEKIKNRDLKTNTDTIVIPIKDLIKRYGKIIDIIEKDLEPYIIEEK